MTTVRLLIAALLLTSTGCTPTPKKPKTAAVVKRAVFDLNCPQDTLRWQKIDARTYGVRGCGESATYVKTCEKCARAFNQYENCNCTWVLDSSRKRR